MGVGKGRRAGRGKNQRSIREELIDLNSPSGIKRYLEEHPRVRQLVVTREVLDELLGFWHDPGAYTNS